MGINCDAFSTTLILVSEL